MGAILGTVPGWQRSPEWTPDNRAYVGPAYIKYEVPPTRIEPEERYEYRVTIDITVYLCDSPDLMNPLVVRRIERIKMISIYAEEYPGGLSQWVSDVSIREAEELLSRSQTEVSGLVPCDKSYDLKTYDEEETLPTRVPEVPKVPEVPEFVLKTIEDLEKRKVSAKTIERKDKIQKAIDELKQEYGIK